MEVVLNCSPIARCLPALLSIVNHRNPQMRGKVCQFLLRVVTLKSLELRGYRDIDAFLNRIPKMISDHTPEARQSTKLIVRALLTTGIVSRAELEIYIASEEIDKVFDKKSVALLQDTKNFTAGVSRRKVTTGVKDTITEAAMIYKTPLIVPLNQGIRMKQGGRRDK